MRVFDLIDVRFAQFRGFKAVLYSGLLDLGVEVIDSIAGGQVEAVTATAEDLVLIPPYGAVIDAVRVGRFHTAGSVLMIDLKGPMGIDSFLMVRRQLASTRCRYATTMAGDAAFSEPLAALRRRGVHVGHLPFFPNPHLIERAGILGLHRREPLFSDREPIIYFAGAIWGFRERCLDAMRQAGLPVVTDSGLPPRQYLDALTRAAVCLDLGGGQSQTYRFHEVLLAGACCLCQRRLLHHPGRVPVDGEHLVMFDGVDDMVPVATELLQDTVRCERIARAGARWYRRSHAPASYATAVLKQAAAEVTSDAPLEMMP